eukprot:c1986_g1_i1.p1 GENE.c1986_g1_i1~~c1986_g1_i1.p1  ORF type:complete len:499 (+),score=3.66 c1986_g1_i1:44-1540(+)
MTSIFGDFTKLLEDEKKTVQASTITWSERSVIALGEGSTTAFDVVRSTFGTPFMLDVAGLDGVQYGNIQLLVRIYDAFTDPMMGYISDTYPIKGWGRRRPWIMMGAIPLSFMYLMLWTTSISTSPYFYLGCLILYETFSTMVDIPFLSLVSEMSGNYGDSISLSTWRTFSRAGMNIVTLGLTSILLAQMNEETDAYRLSALICVIIAIPTLILTGYMAKEKAHYRDGDVADHVVHEPFFSNLKIIVKDKTYMILLGVYVLFAGGNTFTNSTLIMYVEHVLEKDGQYITLMLFLNNFSRMLAAPVMWRLCQWFGKRKLMMIGLFCYGMMSLSVWWIDRPSRAWMFLIVGFVKGFCSQSIAMPTYASLPDIVDKNEVLSGERREASYFSGWTFFNKLGNSLAAAGIGYLLAYANYKNGDDYSFSDDDEDVVQPNSVVDMLRYMHVLMPFVIFTSGSICTYFYDITKDQSDANVAILSSRKLTATNQGNNPSTTSINSSIL